MFWLERRKGKGQPGHSTGAWPLVFGSGIPARLGSLGTRPKAAGPSSKYPASCLWNRPGGEPVPVGRPAPRQDKGSAPAQSWG